MKTPFFFFIFLLFFDINSVFAKKKQEIPLPNFANIFFNDGKPKTMEKNELLNSIYEIGQNSSNLGGVVRYLQDYPTVRMNIDSHVCPSGNGDAYDMELSQRRAEATKLFLIEKGIAPERLNIEYFGASQPTVPNDNANNRSLNNRIEFKAILPKK